MSPFLCEALVLLYMHLYLMTMDHMVPIMKTRFRVGRLALSSNLDMVSFPGGRSSTLQARADRISRGASDYMGRQLTRLDWSFRYQSSWYSGSGESIAWLVAPDHA